MIRSMTGYSTARSEEEGFSLAVSLKSTNHRYLDLQLRYPAGLEAFEPQLRRRIKESVARGHVEMVVTVERAGSGALQVNRGLLKAYMETLQQLRGEYGLAAEPDVMTLLRVPGMISAGSGDFSLQDLAHVGQTLYRVLAEVLNRLNEMRAREGESLEKDLRGRLARLESLSAAVESQVQGIPGFYQKRLQARLKDMMQDVPGGVAPDPARLAQEVAYLASRSDVAEELTRFRSHLEQVSQLLSDGAEVGKKLDFLLQEMNREANTLLSKTTDVPEVGLEVARQAIEMKTEIEKLREQAQNIE
jgi:uncharacterized protein (TIGR00255 family)